MIEITTTRQTVKIYVGGILRTETGLALAKRCRQAYIQMLSGKPWFVAGMEKQIKAALS